MGEQQGLEQRGGTGKMAQDRGQVKECGIYLGKWLSRVSRHQSHRWLGPSPGFSRSGKSNLHFPEKKKKSNAICKICILLSNKLPVDAGAAGLGTALREPMTGNVEPGPIVSRG